MKIMLNVHAYSGNKYAGGQNHNSAEQNSLSRAVQHQRGHKNTHDLTKI